MMKTCPYCGEKIQKLAKKCRYCGERLEETETEKTKTNVVKSKHPDEETTVLYDWFSFNGRLGLFNFYRIIFLYMAVSVVLVPIILTIPNIGQLLLAIISTCIMIYYLGWIINKRLKDRGMNLWNFIACLIPVIGRIYFIYVFINIFFLPGNKGENKYGEEPQNVYLFFKKKWNLGLRVLATACILIIVGMGYTTTPIKHNINRVDYPLENTTEQQKENTTEQQKENTTEQQKENTTEQQKENTTEQQKENTDDKDKWQLVYYPNGITGQEKYGPTFDKLEDCEHGALLSKEGGVDATCNKGCKKMNSGMLMCDKVVRTRWVENGETFYDDDKDMFDYECKSYKNLVYDKLNETFHFQGEPQLAMDEIIDSDIFVLHDYTIGYSPVTKSCIASMRITSYWKTSGGHTKNDTLRIIDVTNDKVLFEDAGDTPEVHDKWEQEIGKYKIVNSN